MGAIAQTTSGQIRGTEQGGSLVFQGVAFARPPVGELRFSAPRPPEPWEGVRDATLFAFQVQPPQR